VAGGGVWNQDALLLPVGGESAPGVTVYGAAAEELVTATTLQAAEVMSDPADLMNRAVEALQVCEVCGIVTALASIALLWSARLLWACIPIPSNGFH
jgi:hypothetical protein